MATLPALQVRGYGAARAAQTLPAFKAYGIGNQITKDINYVAGALIAVGYGGASMRASFPRMVVSITGGFPNTGRLTATLPALRTSGNATIGEIGGITARARALTAQGYGGANLVGVLGTLDAAGAGRSGNVARAALISPKFIVVASGTVNGVNRAEIILPTLTAGPYGSGTAVFGALAALGYGRLVVEITYEAYAINLKPGNRAGVHEVSHYTNWPFDGIVRHGSRYYAWGPAGLFEIGGATDYNAATPLVPTAIPWDWMTTVTDFGSSQKKAMRQMAIGGRIGPNVVAKVATGRDADYSYRYSTSRGQKAQNYRVKLGKGLDDRYYSFGLSGTGEGDVDTIDIDVETLSRKM